MPAENYELAAEKVLFDYHGGSIYPCVGYNPYQSRHSLPRASLLSACMYPSTYPGIFFRRPLSVVRLPIFKSMQNLDEIFQKPPKGRAVQEEKILDGFIETCRIYRFSCYSPGSHVPTKVALSRRNTNKCKKIWPRRRTSRWMPWSMS